MVFRTARGPILPHLRYHSQKVAQTKYLAPASDQFKDEFKATMARISSQAMILTAGVKGFTTNDTSMLSNTALSKLHGMTLSSVCSLSVYPNPLLQFNLHLPSYTSQTIQENGSGYLALHLLPPTSKSVTLSRIFASGIKRDPKHFESTGDDGSVFHEMTTPFKQISNDDYKIFDIDGEHKIPILKELERIFICSRKEVFEIDNHEIWVVNVLQILKPNENYLTEKSKTGGLLYYKRGFHKVGASLSE